ncbi:hypothetical protein HMPREF0083_01802 [Aneurinibacillus aneurinilyticus ATCC 12856]|uniref:Uncharacterized protein n=1 Tax=Aneurinibacillus aneurinilyticus ATCC 12856 TaxID=649747 RepID=U1YGW3_ANEAE|nr:hypothetical protein HMPREF0083_01802 [Aneurinibacillus aneurinilyticus ATCC 12856]
MHSSNHHVDVEISSIIYIKSHLLIIHKVEDSRAIAPARRKRTAIVSLLASTQMFCGPAWLRQKAALYASVWETNRRLGTV